MEIYTSIQIRYRYLILFLISSLILVACGSSNGNSNSDSTNTSVSNEDIDYTPYVYENISIKQALLLAQKEDKMVWTVIGGTENCGYTREFLKILTKTGFFEKYKDKFIFHACNPSLSGNEGYYDILNPIVLPNSYIFDNDGSIVSLHDFQGQSQVDYATYQIESVLAGKPSNPMVIKDYGMGGKRLLRHLEKLIDIAHKSISENKDTLFSAQTMLLEVDSLSRNFYYYYLLTKIANKLGNTKLRNESADIAYSIFAEKSVIRWLELNDSIKQYSSVYKEDQIKSAKLLFEKEVIRYGKINIGKVYQSSLTVENTGKSPLVIFGTHTSCNCVQISYSKAPILPGEKATIKIDYNANIKGEFMKSILFRSNASNRVQKIIVEGEVI